MTLGLATLRSRCAPSSAKSSERTRDNRFSDKNMGPKQGPAGRGRT